MILLAGGEPITDENGKLTNDQYYARVCSGRSDYWRKMAAPRHRMANFLALLRAAAPATLVDLGCGNGELLRELRRHFAGLSLTGIDLSAEQIALNRRTDPGIDWQAQDLERGAAFPPALLGRFDAVVASEVIEHLTEPRRFLQNALLLAKTGGVLLLSTQSGPIHETERRVGHVRHFTKDEAARILSAAGWTPTRVWNTGFPCHDLSKWFANLDPDRTMRGFSGAPYGPAQDFVCWALRIAYRLNSSARGTQLFAAARKNGH
jgi:2-polyprenyl-3-methyl-5-hydroxy-6-metoxy-1,4-benzoquinol methylase